MKASQRILIGLFDPVANTIDKISVHSKNLIIAVCFALIFFIHILRFFLRKYSDLGSISIAEQSMLALVPMCIIILMSLKTQLTVAHYNKLLTILWMFCGITILLVSFIHPVGDGCRALSLSMVIAFPCLYFVWQNDGDYEKFFSLACKGIVGVGAMFFACNFVFVDLDDPMMFMGDRYAGLVLNPNHVGVLASVVIIACLFLIATQRKFWYIYIIIGGVANAFTMMAVSRTSMLTNIVVTIAFAIYFLKMRGGNSASCDKKLLRILLTLVVFLACTIVGAQMVNSLNNADIQQLGTLGTSFDNVYLTAQNEETTADVQSDVISGRIKTEGNDLNRLSSGRVEIWKLYLEKLNLLGNAEIPLKEAGRFSHNVPIEMGYRTGIINGIIFLIIEMITGIYALKRLVMRKYTAPFYLFTILSIFAFCIYSMLETSMFPFYRPEAFIYFIGIAPAFFKQKV